MPGNNLEQRIKFTFLLRRCSSQLLFEKGVGSSEELAMRLLETAITLIRLENFLKAMENN